MVDRNVNLRQVTFQFVAAQLEVFFSFTPWASWGTNSLDSQPWPALISLLFIVSCSTISIPNNIKVFSILIVIGLIAATTQSLGSDYFTVIRAFYNYISLILVPIAFYNIILRYGLPIKMIVFVNFIWIAVAFLEIFYPHLVSELSSSRTTLDRGVTSLAPEPTFFGIFLFFNTWIYLVYHNYRLRGLLFLTSLTNLLVVIFVAKSSLVIVLLGMTLVVVAVFSFVKASYNKRSIFLGFGLLVVIMLVFSIAPYYLEGTRPEKILKSVFDIGVMEVVVLDASINGRLAHIFLSLGGFIENGFMPNGFVRFTQVAPRINSEYFSELFYRGMSKNDIMSWVGAIIFEIGFFGFFALLSVCFLVGRKLGSALEKTVFFMVLLTSVPLALPLPGVIIAMWLNRRKSESCT